jgi:hypothetical protein
MGEQTMQRDIDTVAALPAECLIALKASSEAVPCLLGATAAKAPHTPVLLRALVPSCLTELLLCAHVCAAIVTVPLSPVNPGPLDMPDLSHGCADLVLLSVLLLHWLMVRRPLAPPTLVCDGYLSSSCI